MLTVNIGIQDPLINGQTGIIRHNEFAEGSASASALMNKLAQNL